MELIGFQLSFDGLAQVELFVKHEQMHNGNECQ